MENWFLKTLTVNFAIGDRHIAPSVSFEFDIVLYEWIPIHLSKKNF